MSTPTKRRKKNDYQASPQAARGLDFFFGRQRAKEVKTQESNEHDENGTSAVGETGVYEDYGEEGLTDEQLARKLQAQWDEEDRQGAARPHQPADVGESHTDGEKEPPDKPVQAGNSETFVEPKVEVEAEKSSAFAALGKNTLSLQSATAEEDMTSYTIPFDQSPLSFDPQHYLPDLKKQWEAQGGRATYALLTHCFVRVNTTQSRIKIVDTLVNLIRTLIEGDPESLLPAVWLATNSISPPYIDIELGLGGSAISKALKMVCGLDGAALKTLYNKHGDAGDVAFEAKKRQSLTLRKPKPLTIRGVYESLHKIANAKGQGSQDAKQKIVERLVQDARGAEESRYIVRTLVQHLRIGAVKTTMLIALSRAFLLSKRVGACFETKPRGELAKLSKQHLAEVYGRGEELVKACFARRPNYNDLVPALLEVGIDDELLIRCGLAMHIPLRPMLGGITRDLGDMLTKLQGRDFSCEFKYDGQRAQVHCDDAGKVTIFSRHLEVMTEKYPDLVALVPKIRSEGISSFILEGEVVAIDRESGD
ncbi:ATP-dependent DNA ligase, partial [Hortaea werneckii]